MKHIKISLWIIILIEISAGASKHYIYIGAFKVTPVSRIGNTLIFHRKLDLVTIADILI